MKTFFFLRSPEKFLCRPFFFFFGEHLRSCSWSLASSIPVLGLESVCPRKGCPWPWPRIFFVSLALASSLVSSTPPLLFIFPDIATRTTYSMVFLFSREMKDVVETILPENTLMVYQNPDLVSFQIPFQIMISEPSIKSICI